MTEEITPKEAMNRIRLIVDRMKYDNLPYEQAKIQAQPYLDIVNQFQKQVAKKYGKRPVKISFNTRLT